MLSYYVFKFICSKLGEALILRGLEPRKLKLGSTEGLNHVFLILHLGAEGTFELDRVKPGQSTLSTVPKGTTHTCLEPRRGVSTEIGDIPKCQEIVSKVHPSRPLM